MELVSVCDSDREVLRRHEQKYSVTGYGSIEEMLTNEKLDLVALCSPSGLHPDQTIAAAKHSVNIVTKADGYPLARCTTDGQGLRPGRCVAVRCYNKIDAIPRCKS